MSSSTKHESVSKGLLSIDVGKCNLGYSFIMFNEGCGLDKFSSMMFGIYKIEGYKGSIDSTVVYRVSKAIEFMKQFEGIVDIIIIERQVNINTEAMELMYSLATIAVSMVGIENVVLFAPKLKFDHFHLKYTTANKAHKKLSISMISDFLSAFYPDNYDEMKTYNKKDDIADSMLQAIVWLRINNKVNLIEPDITKVMKAIHI